MDNCISVTLTQGRREYMEDTYIVSDIVKYAHSRERVDTDVREKINTPPKGKLLAVFDGHGGASVANYCRDNFTLFFERHLATYPDVGIALRKTFKELDEKSESIGQRCGSTAAVLIKIRGNIWTANCGDSEIMASYKDGGLSMLTQSHKVEDEIPRLEALGARITYGDGCARLFQMLNLARSIGDYHLKKYVISTPYVKSIKISENLDYIIIGSDGLWDVWDETSLQKEIAMLRRTMLGKGMNYTQMTDAVNMEIVKRSLLRGSGDNITVIIYFL